MKNIRTSLLIFVTLVSLMSSAAFPAGVLADDTLPPDEGEAEQDPGGTQTEESGTGVEVVITDEEGEVVSVDSISGEDALLNGEPVWCPEGQSPEEDLGNCTAPYGSIGDLLIDLAEETSQEDGTIYIQTSGAEAVEVSEMPSADVVVVITQTDVSSELGVVVDGNVQEVDELILLDETIDQSEPTDPSCTTDETNVNNCNEDESQVVVQAVIVEDGMPVIEDTASQIESEETLTQDVGDENVDEITSELLPMPTDAANQDLDVADPNAAVSSEEQLALPDGVVAPVIEEGETLSEVLSVDAPIKDPIWCPDGTTPTPGSSGCTSSFASLGELVDFLTINQPTNNGTIWMEQGPDMSSGAIVINGGLATTWSNFALTLRGGWGGVSGDGSITGTTTFTNQISIVGWQNDVSINDIVVQNTGGVGIWVQTSGDIALDDVSSNGNADNGAYLENCGYRRDFVNGGWRCLGSQTSTVTLTGTNSFNNNGTSFDGAIGAYILTNGDVALNNVTANENMMDTNDNGGVGVLVESNGGDIAVTGTNTFNGNSLSGAQFWTSGTGNVSLQNLNVSSNAWNGIGISLQTGDATVSGTNTFSDVGGDAIIILSDGDIFAANLNTNNTGGIHLETSSGSVSLTGTSLFNNTIYQMHTVFIQAADDVYVEGVTSMNGPYGDGIKIGANGDVTVKCTQSVNNGEYGLEVGFDDGNGGTVFAPATLTLNDVAFSNNASGNYIVRGNSTILTLIQNGPCFPSDPGSGSGSGGGSGGGSGTGTGSGSSSNSGDSEQDDTNTDSAQGVSRTPSFPISAGTMPLNIIGLGDAGLNEPLALNCTQYSEVTLALANGDFMSYTCPATGNVNLARIGIDPAQLPAALPTGYKYISGITSMQAGLDFLSTGIVKISFVIPADLLSASLTVLFWDGSAWVDLSSANFSDGRQVYNRGEKTPNGMYQITTNFSGIFVLVQK